MDEARSSEMQSVPYLRSPAISYDGKQIAFSYAGDIWIVSAKGGEARMITSHSGYDDRPRFSPDGTRLAFMSKRTGNGDIYVISLKTEDVQQLTYHDGADTLDCWSPDGLWLYFSSSREAIGTAAYKVSVNGGTPIRVAGDPYESYYNLAVSPDGKKLAFNNNGDAWWRHGPNPSGASDIWVISEPIGSKNCRKATKYSGRNMWPMWDAEGKGLYFVSDRDGQENIWHKNAGRGKANQITHFEDGRVLRASISGDGKQIVFQRDFGIWRLDVTTGKAQPVPISVRADKKENPTSHKTYSGEIHEFVLSQDDKKIMFTNRGKIFAASADKGTEKGRPAFRLTNTTTRDGQISWSPDSRKAVYVSDREGENQVFLYDFQQKSETQLTNSPDPANNPRFSPDGKWIAHSHGRDEIRLIDAETRESRSFITGIFGTGVSMSPSFAWSPDSKWIAFISCDDNYFSNLYVQNIDETEARQITFLGHIAAGGMLWSPDGKYIIFNTAQYRTEWQLSLIHI